LMPLYGNFRPQEFMPKAKQAALKALELDANLSEAHASLGRILNSYDYDWKGAEREFKQAIKLKPNYPTVYQWYAEFLAFSGRTDEALAAISTALELDPFSLVINRMKGNILIFADRPDEAIAQLNKTIELYPENALIYFNLGDAFVAKKMYAEAVEQYLIALKADGETPAQLEKLRTAYKNKGWEGFWQTHLEILLAERNSVLENDKNAYYKNEGLALSYAANRNKEKALEFLERAFEERESEMITIKMTAFYDFLAEEPRFQELIKKIGLPE
ncbi:MAG TPA: tetratricopeptide repeat protein, partial [Pyrinomonadaceae bacterium]|nr:tetratricopeptide repeat protein [Pyrinomonadaceae bacterium]